VKVAVLDDWFDTLGTLACFEKLDGHEVTVFTDHLQDTDALAERLRGFEALVLIRERTQIGAALLRRLPDLGGSRRDRDPTRERAAPRRARRRLSRTTPAHQPSLGTHARTTTEAESARRAS
jgi:hypothetical protein